MQTTIIHHLTTFLPETPVEKKAASCLLSSLDKASLEAVITEAESPFICFVAEKFLQRLSAPTSNPDIREVLAMYCDRKSKRTSFASEQLRRRFDGQDDGMKTEIACAMLRCGNNRDRKWISDKLTHRWDKDCLTDLLTAWEESGYEGPLTVLAITKAPLEYLVERRKTLDEICGSHFLLKARCCELPEEPLEPEEWRLTEYLSICRLSGRAVDVEAAKMLLKATLQESIASKLDDIAMFGCRGDEKLSFLDLPEARAVVWHLASAGQIELLDEIIGWDKVASSAAAAEYAEDQYSETYARGYCSALGEILNEI